MSKIRVSRVAIKAEVIGGHGETNGTAYNVTVGRLNDCEKEEMIEALSKVSRSSWAEAECPEGTCWTSISFEMYSELEDIKRPTWVCNDANLEFETGQYGQRRLDLVRIDDFSEGSSIPSWFKTDTEDDDDEEEEELKHVTENFTDVGVEVLDVEFAGGERGPRVCYWAKIRLFDLTSAEVEKIKRVYERDPEDLPTRTRCGERLEPGFELEVRRCKEHPYSLKEVTVVLYCKHYAPFKTIGAYSDSIDLIIDHCEDSICPTIVEVTRGEVSVLEPEKRFEYRIPERQSGKPDYFFADIQISKGTDESVYMINARSDKTKIMFISTAASFDQSPTGLGSLISNAQANRRIYTYDNGAKTGIYTHAVYTGYTQDCISDTAEKELPCRAIFETAPTESSDPPKLIGMIFVCPGYVRHHADNLPTVCTLDETLIKMCISDGYLKEEETDSLRKDIDKRRHEVAKVEDEEVKETVLHHVAIKVVNTRGNQHTIQLGRASETEFARIKSLLNLVKCGSFKKLEKSIPGSFTPLNTYEFEVMTPFFILVGGDDVQIRIRGRKDWDRVELSDITPEGHDSPSMIGLKWFEAEEKKINNEEETTMSETPKIREVNLNKVAIRVDSSTTTGTVKITIGRLSDTECRGIKEMVSTYGTGEYRTVSIGRLRDDSLHELSFWVHTSSELKNADIVNARIVANSQSMAVEIVDVRNVDAYPYRGAIREGNWFGLDLDHAPSCGTYRMRTAADAFKPKKVSYNPPATIVWWEDGSKTVVQAQDGESYDPEKGLAMAIAKKALGNTRDYYRTFIHWHKRYDKQFPAAEQKAKYVTPEVEILDDKVTPPAPKTASKKKSTGKKGGKK